MLEMKKARPRGYTPTERQLGVRVNRRTARMQGSRDTIVHREPGGGEVIISLRDQELVDYLQFIKAVTGEEGTPLERVQRITTAVMKANPYDEQGRYHGRWRRTTLGRATQLPVECLDLARLCEATLKASGITGVARVLRLTDKDVSGRIVNKHADVILDIDGRRYVAITTGPRAGQVMGIREYRGSYLREREQKRQVRTEVHEHWERPYFEAVRPRRARG
jgi:hypothetical protein